MRIEQICYDCATEKGWEPVSYPVGMWRGVCDVCKQEKDLSAPRDYVIPQADAYKGWYDVIRGKGKRE